MKLETRYLVKCLIDADWFSRVGQPSGASEVIQVNSWGVAIEHVRAIEWENLHLDLFNRLANAVLEYYGEEECPMDPVGDELRATLVPVSEEKISAARLHPCVEDFVRVHSTADLVLACLETEYEEFAERTFFQSLSGWYLKGHFPCGWQGEYPEGKLILF